MKLSSSSIANTFFLGEPALLPTDAVDLIECGEPLVELGVAGRALCIDGAVGDLEVMNRKLYVLCNLGELRCLQHGLKYVSKIFCLESLSVVMTFFRF